MRSRTLTYLVLGITVTAGVCLYEGWIISRRQAQLEALQQAYEHLVADNHQLRQQQNTAHNQLTLATDDATAKLSEAVSQDPIASAALGAWRDRVGQLRQWASKMPDKTIPEFALLSDDDWLNASKGGDLNSEIGARLALFAVRQTAKVKFAQQLQTALQKYLRAHDDQLPPSMADLQPYFDNPVSDAILQRYAITGTGPLNGNPGDGPPTILERPDAQVDDIFDTQMGIYAHGMSSHSTMPRAIMHTNEILQVAITAYKQSHNGEAPQQVSDLQPYFTEPVDENALGKIGWGWPTN